jgi:hypothetical protein
VDQEVLVVAAEFCGIITPRPRALASSRLRKSPLFGHVEGMAASSKTSPRFVLGLTETDVEEFRVILREECGEDLDMAAAWRRATELLSLFHSFLKREREESRGTRFERPPP